MKNRGLTLTELLAAAAVCMILATVLVPAISGDREKAMQAECIENVRQLMNAYGMYVKEYDGFLPLYNRFHLNDPPGSDTGKWDTRVTWIAALVPYLSDNPPRVWFDKNHTGWPSIAEEDTKFFTCPAEQETRATTDGWDRKHYGINRYNIGGGCWGSQRGARRIEDIKLPSEQLALLDTHGRVNSYITNHGNSNIMYRHSETATVGFPDGGVRSWGEDKLHNPNPYAGPDGWLRNAPWGWPR